MNAHELDVGMDIYWTEIRKRSGEVQRREEAFPGFAAAFAARTPPHFLRDEVAEIVAWKHTDARWRQRAMQGIDALTDESIRGRTALLNQLADPEEAMQAFAGWASGVGPATISALLAAARPDRWPVIDVFALEAMAARATTTWVRGIPRDARGRAVADVRTWKSYVLECRRIAERANEEQPGRLEPWTPRQVDMALWGIGKLLPGRPATEDDEELEIMSESARSDTHSQRGLREVVGRVRDIDPNGKVRRWEIYFDPKEFGDDFPSQHEAMIDVEWPDSTYRIKVGIKPGNPIYFRSPAARVAGGQDTRVTDLCVKHGFGRAGEIRLQVVVPREKFRVVR